MPVQLQRGAEDYCSERSPRAWPLACSQRLATTMRVREANAGPALMVLCMRACAAAAGMERLARQLKQRRAEQRSALPALVAASRQEAAALLEEAHLTALQVREQGAADQEQSVPSSCQVNAVCQLAVSLLLAAALQRCWRRCTSQRCR